MEKSFFLINKATMVLSNIFQTLKYLVAARPVVKAQDLEGRAILCVACYSGYVPDLAPLTWVVETEKAECKKSKKVFS